VSAGVAATAAEKRPFADVLRSADEALYSAKRSGRDKVVVEPFRLVG
jgi:PleD family two-component response regulator